jgi:nucleoside-diphosphate-sugar epimerase
MALSIPAAQPSYDRAASIPYDDFHINAVGALNLLEAARQACPASPFIHLSANFETKTCSLNATVEQAQSGKIIGNSL